MLSIGSKPSDFAALCDAGSHVIVYILLLFSIYFKFDLKN